MGRLGPAAEWNDGSHAGGARRVMRFAYADPPYLGCGHRYLEQHEVDHGALIARLVTEFPDGWALSCSTPSLAVLLPLCPPKMRVLAWCKTWASFKPNVNPAYAWEPVILSGGRKRGRETETIRDWMACRAHHSGFLGSKPAGFCFWIFQALGATAEDELVDLFPGSGAVMDAWTLYQAQVPLALRRKASTLPLAGTGG